MVALDLGSVTAHTAIMNLTVLLGLTFLLCALLGLVGVLPTPLVVEIVLAAIGLVLLFASTGRLRA